MSPKSEEVTTSVECRVSRCGTPGSSRFTRSRAFTLIELMVVVSIMGIVLAVSIPSFKKIWAKGTMQRTLEDIQDIFDNARRTAIMKSVTTEVVFHPKEGRVEMIAGAQPRSSQNGPPPDPYSVYNNGEEVKAEDTVVVGGSGAGAESPSSPGRSTQIPEHIYIQMLDVNLIEYKDMEVARVRFYPNGTCDELTLIMRSVEDGAQRGISTEVTTGLTSILFEQDLQRMVNGRL